MDRPRSPIARLAAELFELGGAVREIVTDIADRDPHTVVLYHGFGADGRLLVHGRALEDEGYGETAADRARWRNVWDMLRRIDADPLPGARVALRVGSTECEVVADDEGYFRAWLPAGDAERLDEDWVVVHGELREPSRGGRHTVSGRVLFPRHRPELVVVSDMDDTVLQSNVTNLLRAARTMFLENARTRLPFPGIAAFYQALRAGRAGTGRNPVYYVSSSPWNLYDVLVEFLDAQGIPVGPLLLRDMDLGPGALGGEHHHTHKREMVRHVLNAHPGVPALLVGDSGQEDPEIYRDVVAEFPGRIQAVYIRNVTQHPERSAKIQALAEEVRAAGSTLILADDTLAAARHAAEQGWIDPAALASIGEEKRADEGATAEKAPVPGVRNEADAPAPTVVVDGARGG